MLGYFITRITILLVGYAYPAYGCYKCVEKKKPEIQELRYWCKYWVLVGLLTVFERIGDIIVSWYHSMERSKSLFSSIYGTQNHRELTMFTRDCYVRHVKA